MLFEDTYLTIEKPCEAIFRDRGSKFMAYAYPIKTDQDIKSIIADLKKKTQKPIIIVGPCAGAPTVRFSV